MKIFMKVLVVAGILFVSLGFTKQTKAATIDSTQEEAVVLQTDTSYEVIESKEEGVQEINGVARTTYSKTIRFRFGYDSDNIDILLTVYYYYSDGNYVEIQDYYVEHQNMNNVIWANEATHKVINYSDSSKFVLEYNIRFASISDSDCYAMMYIDIDYWGSANWDSDIQIGQEV